MSTEIVPGGSTIGNAGRPAEEKPPTGPFSATSNHAARPPIGRPGANTEADLRANLLRMAREWYAAGCAVHPAKPDGSKVPKSIRGGAPDGQGYGWKRLSTGELERLPLDELESMLRRSCDGIGLFCGPQSGELEMLELEGRAAHMVELLAARAEERGIGELWRRFDRGCSEVSPSGGIHWFATVTDGPALGNTKLALRQGANGKPETIAETRGRGGWVVVAGSFGRTHGSGKPYVLRSGSPATIARVTAAERDALHELFRTLDELPEVTTPPKPVAKRERPDGQILPGDDFDERGTWEDVFPSGWEKLSSSPTADAWSMHGKGGRKTADVYHNSDTLYIYDTDCRGAGQSLGKFGAYAWLRHDGDFRAAAAELYRQGYGTRAEPKPGARAHELPAVRVEPAPAAPLEVVAIDQYRRDIVQALADVVLDGKPGMKLLRGDPGTGKTYAVSRTVARYAGGVVSVPGHELAAEVVEQLRAAGADAAAYPRLDETTCANFEVASKAQAAGLSAPATVCGRCPLVAQCRETGYLAGVRRAEQAPHKVVTHARLSRSSARLVEKAEYVVLEEDPSAVLAPMVSANRRQLERLGSLGATFADARERVLVLEGLELVEQPETFSEFDAWAPAPRSDVHQAEPEAAGQAAAIAPTDRRLYPRGFFGSLCRVADELAAAAARALVDDLPDGVHEIRVEPVRDLPKNPEGNVWQALNTIDRVDPEALLGIASETMQLVLAVATGRAERVFVQVETDTRPGGKRTVEVSAMWRTRLDWFKLPVFVNDGTLELDALKRLVVADGFAREAFDECFVDITPTGRVPLLHDAKQYPIDILPSTSSAKVAAILAGIVRANPDKPNVGVLLHQRHYRELVEAEDSPLPADVRSRIIWATYFGSGADRGTNTLHRLADLAVIIGTHRPPPAEIRRTLARWGELEAAASSPTWGRIDRQGVGHDGGAVGYHGRGYAELAWAQAADATIRATMRQAVGRARAIAPDGVPVVAVTTEAVGLPVVAAEELPVAPPRLDELLSAVAGAVADGVKIGSSEACQDGEYRAKNPIDRYRENCAILPPPGVTADEIEKRLPGVSPRTVQLWLRDAIDAGLVLRSGAARATRYTLASTSTAGAVVLTVPEPIRKPEPAPAPLSLARADVSDVQHVVEIRPDRPVQRPPPPPPPVVAEQPAGPDWLDVVLAPERHPDEQLALAFYMAGPHARDIGISTAWAYETPPLVLKLHKVATVEARRQGRPPPPVEIVARHTVSWYTQTLRAVAG